MTKNTKKWIEEMQKKSDNFPRKQKGGLFDEFCGGYTLSYTPKTEPSKIWLKGRYSIDQLKALTEYMEKQRAKC